MCIIFRTDMRKRSMGERADCTSTRPSFANEGLTDLIDLVLWDLTGDLARWIGTIGDLGRGSRGSSSGSGVRERPSESLKLFSLGIVDQVVVVVNEGENTGDLVFGCPYVTTLTTASGRSSKQPICFPAVG